LVLLQEFVMKQVNIHEAKTNLSRLIADVEHGDEVIIARHNRPVAKLVMISSSITTRKPGSMKGRIRMSDDFNDALPDDLLTAFEGPGI